MIACANLANLMLVRTHSSGPRDPRCAARLERAAGRIIQQLLAERPVAWRGRRAGRVRRPVRRGAFVWLLAIFGTALPRSQDVAIDGSVLAFTTATALVTGLLAAFVPAWQLSGRDANTVLKLGTSRGNSAGGDGHARQALVVSEVALALMLLIGARPADADTQQPARGGTRARPLAEHPDGIDRASGRQVSGRASS